MTSRTEEETRFPAVSSPVQAPEPSAEPRKEDAAGLEPPGGIAGGQDSTKETAVGAEPSGDAAGRTEPIREPAADRGGTSETTGLAGTAGETTDGRSSARDTADGAQPAGHATGGEESVKKTPATAKPAKEPTAKRVARIQKAYDDHTPVQGKVVAIVRGGYEVEVEGMTAFCPFNQIDIRRNDDQLSFVRQTLAFLVTSCKRRGRNISLSRRRYLEREARRAQRAARRKIKAGSIHDGTITSLTDFGAFVDLGGAQGMIHVSEISHERVSRPADKLKVGDPVRVRVLRAEAKKGRIALSLKALEPDPWEAVASHFKVNDVIAGRLVRVTEFGVFVEVAPRVDGLIHVSELPEGALAEMKGRAGTKQEMNVMVLRVEPGKKRISLAPAPDGTKPGEKVSVPSTRPGGIVNGRVESASSEGVIVRLAPGRVGLIPPNETSTPRGADLVKAFPVGTELKVMVMRGDRDDRRVRLSIRRAERQEERRQLEDYRKSAVSGAGSFATLGDFFRKKD